MDESLTDPRCVATVDALVLDGANGVCRDARLGARDEGAWRAGALALAVLVALAILVAPRKRALVGVLALALALPGLAAMTTLRADRPTEVARSATSIAALHGSIRAFAARHGCARVTRSECVACEPIARLALAGLACERPAAIELHEGALERGCEERDAALVCGAR